MVRALEVMEHHRPLEEDDTELVCMDCLRCFPTGNRWCAHCGSADIAWNVGEGAV